MISQNLINIYDEIFDSNQNFAEGLIRTHINHIREMDEFLPPSSSFFILSDTTNNTFPFISKNFDYNIGLSREQMKLSGPNYWLNYFHPEDVGIWVHILKDLMQFTLTEIEPEKRRHLSYTWNFRVKTHSDKFVNVFEHQIPLLLDESGKPVIGLGHLTVTGNGEFEPLKATIKCLNEKEEYETLLSKNYSQNMLSDGLSNREKDIIRLLSLRKTSKQIGETLFISPHTVDTHRRNILKKLNISSTGELVAYFRTNTLF